MPDESAPAVEPVADRAALFAAHRPYLFAVAYRMLGLAEDAEDVLQDAWLRFSAGAAEPEHPRTYLVTIVTRLCLDLLRSARRRREEYVGVWLPEPVRTREALADDLLEKAESASFAFLLLLERLSPLQRAVLVLHDVFDYSHDEVARACGRTAAASRQVLRRARLKLGDARRPGRRRRTPPRRRRPVGHFLATVSRKGDWGPVVVTELNSRPAVCTYEQNALTNAILFDVTGDGITAIYVVRNPDKLQRLAAGGN